VFCILPFCSLESHKNTKENTIAVENMADLRFEDSSIEDGDFPICKPFSYTRGHLKHTSQTIQRFEPLASSSMESAPQGVGDRRPVGKCRWIAISTAIWIKGIQ
jgi:hypothetical protein